MDESNPVYSLKRIKFFSRDVAIVCQNENGPCPLLAIVNVLSLRNQIKLPSLADHIDQERLIALVANFLIESNALRDESIATPEYKANLERNLADAIALLPKLTTGIDVNVQFDGIRSFEFTDEIAIFDLMDIGLVHGWLVDPEDASTWSALGQRSYNEAVEHIVVTLGAAEAAGMATPQSSRKASSAMTSTPVASVPSSLRHINTAPVTTTTTAGGVCNEGSTQPLSPVSGGGEAQELHPQHVQQMLDMGAGDVQEAMELHAALQLSLTQQHDNNDDHEASRVARQITTDIMHRVIAAATTSTSTAAAAAATAAAGGDAVVGHEDAIVGHDDAAPVVGEAAAAAATTTTAANTKAAPVVGEAADINDNNNKEGGEDDMGEVGRILQGIMQRVVRQHSNTTATPSSKPAVLAVKPTTAAVREAKAIKDFLESSSNQLTWHGLQSLMQNLRANELAVFFRNNHFNTIFSHKGHLYLLVTDLGFLWEKGVVWEALCSVQGDTHFCTEEFVKYTGEGGGQQSGSQPQAPLRLSDAQGDDGVAGHRVQTEGDELDPDLLLALQLQDEEDAQHRAMIQQRRQQQEAQQRAAQAQQPPPSHHQRLGGVPPSASQGRQGTAAAQAPSPRGRRVVQQHQKSKSKDCVVM